MSIQEVSNIMILLISIVPFRVLGYTGYNKKIQHVTVKASSDATAGKAFADTNIQLAAPEGAYYRVARYEILTEGDHWRAGECPNIRVYFSADPQFYFRIIRATQIEVDGGAYYSARREDEAYTLSVDIKLPMDGIIPEDKQGDKPSTWSFLNNHWMVITWEGDFIKSNWFFSKGDWYYLDENGYMKTGWISTDEGRFFFGDDGKLFRGITTEVGDVFLENGRYAGKAN